MSSDGSSRAEQLLAQNPYFFPRFWKLDEKANDARSKSLSPIPKFIIKASFHIRFQLSIFCFFYETSCRTWPSGGIFRQKPFAANLRAAHNSFARQLCFA